MHSTSRYRIPFVVPAMLCLVGGVLTGLVRAGANIPDQLSFNAAVHSILIISGFFGTVIGLERAVATQRIWPYLAPLFSGLAGLTLLLGLDLGVVSLLFTLGSLCFVLASIHVYKKHPATHAMILLIAGALWFIGNSLWLVQGAFWASIPYGLSFLVLTIAGERLELTRFLPPKPFSKLYFIAIVFLIIVGTILSGLNGFIHNTELGIGYAALAIWLLRFDIARRTVRQSGVTRFVAICLLSGYAWLLAGGLLLTDLINLGIFQRDAGIHAVALGFIFTMVIGHAPIIFPAVMRVPIPFSNIFYIPLCLIEFGVALRLCAAFLSSAALREAGAVVNAVAILTFILCLLWQVRLGVRSIKQPQD